MTKCLGVAVQIEITAFVGGHRLDRVWLEPFGQLTTRIGDEIRPSYLQHNILLQLRLHNNPELRECVRVRVRERVSDRVSERERERERADENL